MTKKKLKRNEIDPTELKARKFLNSTWKKVRKYYKYMMNWYFFYKPTDDGDKALHIILMLFVDAIILRFFGII